MGRSILNLDSGLNLCEGRILFASLGWQSGRAQGQSRRALGQCWALVCASVWARSGSSVSMLGAWVPVWTCSADGQFGHAGASLGVLGANLGVLGASLNVLGTSAWAGLGVLGCIPSAPGPINPAC